MLQRLLPLKKFSYYETFAKPPGRRGIRPATETKHDEDPRWWWWPLLNRYGTGAARLSVRRFNRSRWPALADRRAVRYWSTAVNGWSDSNFDPPLDQSDIAESEQQKGE